MYAEAVTRATAEGTIAAGHADADIEDGPQRPLRPTSNCPRSWPTWLTTKPARPIVLDDVDLIVPPETMHPERATSPRALDEHRLNRYGVTIDGFNPATMRYGYAWSHMDRLAIMPADFQQIMRVWIRPRSTGLSPVRGTRRASARPDHRHAGLVREPTSEGLARRAPYDLHDCRRHRAAARSARRSGRPHLGLDRHQPLRKRLCGAAAPRGQACGHATQHPSRPPPPRSRSPTGARRSRSGVRARHGRRARSVPLPTPSTCGRPACPRSSTTSW